MNISITPSFCQDVNTAVPREIYACGCVFDTSFDYKTPLKNGQKNTQKDIVHIHTNLGNPLNGAINPNRVKKPSHISMVRLERWALHSVCVQILMQFLRKDKRNMTQYKFRVVQCMQLPLEQYVKIYKKNKTPHYQGLNTCGSVWTCPICAAKITERRRIELKSAMERWKEKGGHVFMVTSTVPHSVFDRLTDLLDNFQRARRKWRNRKPWARTKNDFCIAGSIRCLEIVWTKCGWHVHSHELFFLSPEYKKTRLSIPRLKADLFRQWEDACVSVGFGEPSIKGFDVQDGSAASKYVTKWGLDNELTKQHSKRLQRNYTPFDLLRAVLDDGDVSDFSAADRFQEYAHCTFGKAQLDWSPGLKKLLGVEALSDQEICDKTEDDSIFLGLLTLEDWRKILKHDLRGRVLEYANLGGIDAVNDYLSEFD